MISNTKSAAKALFKMVLSSLVQAKVDNSPDFDDTVDAFAEDFANRVESAQNLNDIQREIILRDETSLKEAKNFYSDIPDSHRKLRNRLVEAREAMNLNMKYGNYKKSCKYLVVQAEAMCNELSRPEFGNFIQWLIKKGTVSIVISKDLKDNKYLTTKYLILAADLRYNCQTNHGLLNDVKAIRDYESHGYIQEEVDKMEALLINITKNWDNYQAAWDEFLGKLINAFYYPSP